jgi:hypothetical protein
LAGRNRLGLRARPEPLPASGPDFSRFSTIWSLFQDRLPRPRSINAFARPGRSIRDPAGDHDHAGAEVLIEPADAATLAFDLRGRFAALGAILVLSLFHGPGYVRHQMFQIVLGAFELRRCVHLHLPIRRHPQGKGLACSVERQSEESLKTLLRERVWQRSSMRHAAGDLLSSLREWAQSLDSERFRLPQRPAPPLSG